MKVRSALAAVSASVALSAGSAIGAPVYEITDLGRVDGFAINDAGQATGATFNPGPVGSQAFIYSSGALTIFGPPVSFGFAINNAGSVVGSVFSDPQRSFVYRDGLLVNFDAALAQGINASEQIVGTTSSRAFLYSNGVFTDLGSFGGPGSSGATAINDAGQVTGFADRRGGFQVPFLFSDGAMVDIFAGTRITYGNGLDVNANGQVVGTVDFKGLPRLFTFADGVASVFDAVGAATGVNDAGAFVGALDDGAFVSYGGGIADLNQLLDPVSGAGWHLGAARGINNNGQIIGGGTFENDVRGFIATCVSGCGDPLTTRLNIVDVSAIPEPETYALMLAGFGMLQLALRRNRSTRSPAARHFIA
jgi:probable HAF family extracellular repeat protein